jgi:hypothetical protein
MSLTKRHAEKMGWFDDQGYNEYDTQYAEYKKKMDKDEVIEWIYNLPLQTLTDDLKYDIVEKIEELTNKTQDNEKRFDR